MKIGVPTEVKNSEYRVAITPAGVRELVSHGHTVLVQSGAGRGSGFTDEAYARQGGTIVNAAPEVWGEAELVVKVKEPVPSEYPLLREDQVLFTYLHLAASRECTDALMSAGTTAIGYETVQLGSGLLPLLQPMSEIAGRLSIQVGAYHLLREHGGAGVLLGGIAGSPRGNVLVVGGGIAGQHAAANAIGVGAAVTVMDVSLTRLRAIQERFGASVETRVSTDLEIAEQVADADLVVAAAHIPGAQAPKVITDAMLAEMRPGSVLVDVAIDQGGCIEGSRPTTHEDPTFRVHDALLYCVTNMASAVPQTSTRALTNATLPYIESIADWGWRLAMQQDPALTSGLNVWQGQVTNHGVAEAFDLDPVSPSSAILGGW